MTRLSLSDPESLPDVMSPREVGDLFRVDPRTVRKWTELGLLPCFRTPGGHRRYLRADVLAAFGEVNR